MKRLCSQSAVKKLVEYKCLTLLTPQEVMSPVLVEPRAQFTGAATSPKSDTKATRNRLTDSLLLVEMLARVRLFPSHIAYEKRLQDYFRSYTYTNI